MTRRIPKRLAVLGAGLLLLIGGGAAVAASGAGSDEFVADVATRLGVSQAKLEDAIVAARKAHVDEALADGRITKAQADRIKDQLESGDIGAGFGPGFRGGGPGFGHHGFGGLDAAATYLGLTEAELRDALDDGTSLAALAQAEGKTVAGLKQALVAEQRKRIDEALADERLTKAQADELRSRVAEHVDELVERTGFGGGFHRGFHHGPRGASPSGLEPAAQVF